MVYLRNFADTVADYSNYFVALAAVPAGVGGLIGLLGAAFLARAHDKRLVDYIVFPVAGILAAVLPVANALFWMARH